MLWTVPILPQQWRPVRVPSRDDGSLMVKPVAVAQPILLPSALDLLRHFDWNAMSPYSLIHALPSAVTLL